MNGSSSTGRYGASMRWMTRFLGCALFVGCGSAVEDEQDTDDGSSGMVGSSSSGALPGTSSSGSTSIDESTTGGSTSDTTTGLDTSSGPHNTGEMETGSTETGSTETGSTGSSSGGDDTTTGVVDTADYLFALSAIVAPDTPFQFVGTIDADDTTVELSLTPLSLNIGATDLPREPVPPTLAWTGDVTDGVFTIDVPMQELVGPTNPITGSDIEASIQIVGQFEGDNLCAAVTGQVTVPANIDLAGSTFSAMPLDLGPSPEPEELPLPSAIVCP